VASCGSFKRSLQLVIVRLLGSPICMTLYIRQLGVFLFPYTISISFTKAFSHTFIYYIGDRVTDKICTTSIAKPIYTQYS
jgi:hypothetical protein